MKIDCSVKKHILDFKFLAGTSRGTMKYKTTYFIEVLNSNYTGVGEASPLIGLSVETPDSKSLKTYENKLEEIAQNIQFIPERIEEISPFLKKMGLEPYPSLFFGFEMAITDFLNQGKKLFFETPFTKGQTSIPINGLVWMGHKAFMQKQIKDKIEAGFDTIKMKIGAIDWKTELELLSSIRTEFTTKDLTLRVDANGAFDNSDIWEILDQLAKLDVHSIEQPVAAGQEELMSKICKDSPIPVALDEELIGIFDLKEKEQLLTTIKPQFIILKPSLVGGFKASNEWISIAERHSIGWWITSALESNIGLNAIAQFTAHKKATLPQGLGTGDLYHNNVPPELRIENGHLFIQ